MSTDERDDPGIPAVEIDTTVAHAARIYDYLLGGTTNFEVDRQAAVYANADMPGGLDGARTNIRANRDFLIRAVRWLAAEAGVRQFLDIGTGIPNADNVHGIAQHLAPESRVVYVDNDPIVLAHAHALLSTTAEGATSFVNGDLCDPTDVLLRAESILDFNEPVAVMLIAILHFVDGTDDPYEIVNQLIASRSRGHPPVLHPLRWMVLRPRWPVPAPLVGVAGTGPWAPTRTLLLPGLSTSSYRLRGEGGPMPDWLLVGVGLAVGVGVGRRWPRRRRFSITDRLRWGRGGWGVSSRIPLGAKPMPERRVHRREP